MSNDNNEKLYSQKEVLEMFSKSLGVKETTLVDSAEGKDLSTLNSMSSFLKEAGVEKRNQEFDKGFEKAAKKKESLFREVFPDVDFQGMQIEDMLIHIRDVEIAKAKQTNNKEGKVSTLEQALEVPAIKQVFDNLKTKAAAAEKIQGDFDKYQKVSKLSNIAIAQLEKEGAQFSSDPARKLRQIKLIEQELESLNFKMDESGNPILLDSDNLPKRNLSTGDDFTFNEYLKGISPVDFAEKEIQKPKKETPTPRNPSGSDGNTHGYTGGQLKELTVSDYNAAKSAGLSEKANFIKEQMTNNLSSE